MYSENDALYNVETRVSARQATGNIIRRMRSSCRITKPVITGTKPEYLILADFPRPQRLLEGASRLFPFLLICTFRALSAAAAVVVQRRLKR